MTATVMTTSCGGSASLVVVFLLSTLVRQGSSIGCYYCVSQNGSDPLCADPFQPAFGDYRPYCKSGKRDRIGKMPAQYCIKIKGTPVGRDEELVVRTCALYNMDRQCGMFEFENDGAGDKQTLEGCILTCNLDGCNTAAPHRYSSMSLIAVTIIIATATAMRWCDVT